MIKFEVDPKFYSVRGMTSEQPLMFAGAFQPSSFHLNALWRFDSGRFITGTNGTIWGGSGAKKWIVYPDGTVCVSVTNTADANPDPVAAEVGVYRSLADIPLRLGFPRSVTPVSVGEDICTLKTDTGETLRGELTTSNDGRVERIVYRTTNNMLSAEVIIEYSYEQGPRPHWMPAKIRASAREMLTDGRRVEYADTYFIRSCALGAVGLTNGFMPDMFLSADAPLRSLIWSNGQGLQIEGTNVTPILPPDTPSAASLPESGIMWPRVAVITFILLATLMLGWLMWSRMKLENTR